MSHLRRVKPFTVFLKIQPFPLEGELCLKNRNYYRYQRLKFETQRPVSLPGFYLLRFESESHSSRGVVYTIPSICLE